MELHSSIKLDTFRGIQDPMADKVIEEYFPADKALLASHLKALEANADELPKGSNEALIVLWKNIKNQAKQFDTNELEKGQAFFDQNASDIMLLLGFLSLPYCYAAAYGAEVLVKSRRILEEPETRLLDTASFVFNVTNKVAFKPQGTALTSILSVRLLHAATRWYISQAGDWDSELKGKPINQEDMAGTNLSFSLMTIRGLRRLGKSIDPKMAYDYIDYWNKIGSLLGLSPDLLPSSNREAFYLEKAIRNRHFKSSEAGLKLTDSLYKYYEKAVVDTPLDGFTKPFMIYLLGDKVARQLGLSIRNYDKITFKPYQLFLNFKNYFFGAQDSYAKAFARFRESKPAD